MKERSPIEWAVRPLKKYADFGGRAPRAEYWWFSISAGLVGAIADYLDSVLGSSETIGLYGPVGLAYTLALLVPSLSVTMRRLHDIDRSGWWILLNASWFAFTLLSFVISDFEGLLAVTARINTGILLVVVLGWIAAMVVMLVFMVTRGTEGANRYGPDPYGPDSLQEVFA